MVESALVIMMLSLVLFGMIQVALALHADQVQKCATSAAARSRVVGFNDAVVEKAWVFGNILNSGAMLSPQTGLSEVAQTGVEVESIPLFLQSAGTVSELSPQLEYADWKHLPSMPPFTDADLYTAQMQQDYPLHVASLFPFLAASFGTTNVTLKTSVTIENHFPLYLQVQ